MIYCGCRGNSNISREHSPVYLWPAVCARSVAAGVFRKTSRAPSPGRFLTFSPVRLSPRLSRRTAVITPRRAVAAEENRAHGACNEIVNPVGTRKVVIMRSVSLSLSLSPELFSRRVVSLACCAHIILDTQRLRLTCVIIIDVRRKERVRAKGETVYLGVYIIICKKHIFFFIFFF